MDLVDAVVAPFIVESQPRKILVALAAGIPVIATEACGLGDMQGVRTVPALDSERVAEAIVELCSSHGERVEPSVFY